MSMKKWLEYAQKNNLQPNLNAGHRPMSRRDLVGQGFLTGSSMLLAPSLFSIFEQSALGACSEGDAPGATGMIPMLVFEEVGGGNLVGSNVMVGGDGGQTNMLSNYTSMGAPGVPASLDTSLKLAFHPLSAMLAGIHSMTANATRGNTDGLVICNQSDDDGVGQDNNVHNPIYWIASAGRKGSTVQLVGPQNTQSGGSHRKVAEGSFVPTLAPVVINSVQAARSLAEQGALSQILGNDQSKLERVYKAIEKMSGAQVAKFAAKDFPDQVKELVNCGYLRAGELGTQGSADSLDYTKDVIMNPLAAANANGGGTYDNSIRQFALTRGQDSAYSVVKLVLDGYAAAGTISFGGYDYHGQDRAVTNQKDFDVGRMIGFALESAARKKKDLVICVLTNGGISSRGGDIDTSARGGGLPRFNSDSGERSAVVMLAYSAKKAAFIRSGKEGRQIGYYNQGGIVEKSTIVGSNGTNAAKAFVLNYLALHGKEADFTKVVGSSPFGKLDDYLFFSNIVA